MSVYISCHVPPLIPFEHPSTFSSRLPLFNMSPRYTAFATAALVSQTSARLTFAPCPQLNELITTVNQVPSLPTFDCGTLAVPLDYTDNSSTTLDLAVFRVNATQQPSIGSVLMNFGGPGGTGAENLPAYANQAHHIIGPQWDLVSWDPRGTGNTLPFQCNLTDFTPASISNTKRDTESLVSTNLTAVFLNFGWDFAGIMAEACYEQSNQTGNLIGTAFTARDMMEIVDALGEDGLLRYYGWSYGTVLGSFVAAMFPDRMERVVLDGNLNPHDYQSGTYGEIALHDDAAFEAFLDTCYHAGNACALNEILVPNSTADYFNKINALLAQQAPAASHNATSYSTWAGLKSQLIQALYFPVTWPSRAQTFADLLAATLSGKIPPIPDSSSNVTYGNASPNTNIIGIRASDAIFHANSSAEYLPIVEQQAAVSPGFSDAAYYSLWPSARWLMPAAERYWGDFNVTTKTPILYVNGQYDPVTPLTNAFNASQSFHGSSVLQHSGYGHGLFASPSECAARYVRAYFLNGTLPANATECLPDQTLLQTWLANVAPSNASSNGTVGGGNSTSPDATPSPAVSNGGSLVRGVNSEILVAAAFATLAFVM